ncbi:MAG TPA: serine protease, partial [Planctomycetaceae bacterium]|nr:serine protease [Planctomycetaceae bacterium]
MAVSAAICGLACASDGNPTTQPEGTVTEANALAKAAQARRVAIMKQASAATVAIFGAEPGGGGSGVLISEDGYALTNYHVSSACGDTMRCGLDDGRVYEAVIVGVDATGDVSLIKLFGRDDFPTATLADSSQVRVGQWCFAAGNPFVLATNLQPSVSLGIVSGIGRYQYPAGTLLEYADCIQTDAAINPGNSGGPLFNLAGEVIGVNGRCSFEKRGRVNVGVGYSISANQLKYFIEMLKSGRLVDHATLGATAATSENGRVLVSNILPGSDAYRRGLRYGDEIVALADRSVRTTNEFKNVLGTLPAQWRVPLTIRRNGNLQTILVRLAAVHTQRQLIELVSAGIGGPSPGPDNETPDAPPEDSDEPSSQEQSESNDTSADSPAAEHFEAKAGFANYYFNRKRIDELWRGSQELASRSGALSQTLKLAGKLAGEETPFQLTTTPESSKLTLGVRTITLNHADEVASVIGNRAESGLLVALRALAEYYTVGPDRMGSATYMGHYPVYSSSDLTLTAATLCPMLECLWLDSTVRLYFSQDSGRITLVEVAGDDGDDPVELYLDYKADAATLARLRLQYGPTAMLLLDV